MGLYHLPDHHISTPGLSSLAAMQLTVRTPGLSILWEAGGVADGFLPSTLSGLPCSARFCLARTSKPGAAKQSVSARRQLQPGVPSPGLGGLSAGEKQAVGPHLEKTWARGP